MMSLNNSSAGGVAVSVAGKGDSLKRGIRFSHFARMESSQVLEAAILDLINIFQIKVVLCVYTYIEVLLTTLACHV